MGGTAGGTVVLRVVRAAVFAGVSLSLSAGGQLLVTGAPLPVATVLWAGLAVFLLALLLAAGERGYLRIAAVLAPLELVLNATFNLGQASCGPGVPPTTSGRSLNGLPDLLLCGGGQLHGPTAAWAGPGPGLPHLTLPPAPSAWQFSLLLAVHLLAALLAALWLRRGEAAVFRTLRAVAAFATAPLRVLFAVLVPLVQTAGVGQPPAPRRSQPGPQQVLLRTARRRGPPPLPAMC
ncbi:hypothetical protein ACEZDB_26330 [Streptacidiphilus sp. N1-3]|uniref:Integral membrane protein n=1 Tax=Streptacidiphilus alkalitolerans TaxID=3342712 RepID=A0ABV6X7L9_9ACTN